MFARIRILSTSLNRCGLVNPSLVVKRNFKKQKQRNPPHLWKEQKEILAEMGVHVGDDPRNPDTLAQLEALDDIHEEMGDFLTRNKTSLKIMTRSEEERKRKFIKRKIIERKYFKKPPELNLLTWDAKEQIKHLHEENPEEWSPERIAESFPVSVEGAKRVLKSSWKPRYIEEIIKHDRRVQQRWLALKSGGEKEGGPIANRYQQLLEEGKLGLVKNAVGQASLPMPERIPLPSKHSRYLNRDPNKPPGPWASIVHDYCELRDNLTGKNPNLITKGECSYVPQKQRQELVDEQRKLLEDVTNAIAKDELEEKREHRERKKSTCVQDEYERDEDAERDKTLFQDWFRLTNEEETLKNQESRGEAKPTNLFQSTVREDAELQKRQRRASSLRQPRSLRRRRLSMSPEEGQQNPIESMLHSDDDVEDMAAMFKRDSTIVSGTKDPALDESRDPGLIGTKKIRSRGVGYTELMKQVPNEDKYTSLGSYNHVSPFGDRKGAYGYFKDDIIEEHNAVGSDVNELLETIEHNESKDGQPYYYNEQTGEYEYPYGKKQGRLNEAQISDSQKPVYKKGNDYYDESGEFMFRIPVATREDENYVRSK